jgi:hypothetical protein
MNSIRLFVSTVAIFILLVSTGQIDAQEITVESIRILRIIGQEETAMIKLPDGRMQILKVGDALGKNGKVIEIVEGRLVIEEKTDKGIETVIIRFEDGKQKIERIRRTGGKQPGLYSPIQKEKTK